MGKLLKSSDPVDRISDLTDSILCHILSFLPTNVAHATSVLSRRWRFLWTRVPAISFDLHDYPNENGYVERSKKFVQIVEKVLRQNAAGRLEKFQLGLHGVKGLYIENWVRYAIARNVRVLDLQLFDYYDSVPGAICLPLPGALFTSGTLENLRLLSSRYCQIKIPSVACLPRLEVLNIKCVYYESDACLNNLIAGCPVLRSLTIVKMDKGNVPALKISSPSLSFIDISYKGKEGNSETGGKIEIDAPALESLFLAHGRSQEFMIIVKRAREVKEVKFKLGNYYNSNVDVDQCNLLVGTIQALDRVKLLKLKGLTLLSLSHATTPLAASFDRLTKLKMECHCCNWSSLNAVLGCCFILQDLKIRVRRADFQQTHKECWREPEEVPIWLLRSLKKVSFCFHSEISDVWIAMIRYILLHGAMMKTLKIWSSSFYAVNNNSEIFEKISMLPRASPNVKLDLVTF